MMNATVEKLVKAVEGRVAPKGYVVSFAETKRIMLEINPESRLEKKTARLE